MSAKKKMGAEPKPAPLFRRVTTYIIGDRGAELTVRREVDETKPEGVCVGWRGGDEELFTVDEARALGAALLACCDEIGGR